MTRYLVALLCLFTVACDYSGRLAKLEKENKDLQQRLNSQETTVEAERGLDLQAKCSADAKRFFTEGWQRDRETLLLDYSNHYSKTYNKCFIEVEQHIHVGTDLDWDNYLSIWDIYENVQYGHVSQAHLITQIPERKEEEPIYGCEVAQKQCKTLDEFAKLSQVYMSN